jgi:hypothetical protein
VREKKSSALFFQAELGWRVSETAGPAFPVCEARQLSEHSWRCAATFLRPRARRRRRRNSAVTQKSASKVASHAKKSTLRAFLTQKVRSCFR